MAETETAFPKLLADSNSFALENLAASGETSTTLLAKLADPETVAKLAVHENIAGIKEASGDMSYAARIARLTGDDFAMYSGNDDITVALMSMGAVGAVSVWANLMPGKVREMTHAFLDGDTDKARKIQLENLNLINALFCETNPVPVKALMNMKGMNVGGCRLPLGPLCGASRRVLRNLADSLELPR